MFLVVLTTHVFSVNAQDLELASLFSNHMVLQREQIVPVWGTSAPNEKITLRFAGQTKTTLADKTGNWVIQLEPMKASKKGRTMFISGKQEMNIVDVLVGEVWICSGQSNMQFEVHKSPEVKGLIPFAKNIRSFEVKQTISITEKENVQGTWITRYPNSAVAFSFAYFLKDVSDDVPIGIILSSWGSSSLEAWMPKDMTTTLPYFKKIMEEFDANQTTQSKIKNILAKKEGWSIQEDIFLRRQPNILYNAMMKPLAPYGCAGLVWYQGERNTRYLSGVPEVTEENWFHRVAGMKEYGKILKEWIKRYRKEWKNEKMNFMIVMLPGFGKGTVQNKNIDIEDPTAESWAWMRESQLQVLDIPYTSVANTIDLGDAKNVHPTDKLPIGQRLALLAKKNTNHTTGPMLESVEVFENEIQVRFKYVDKLKTSNGKMPTAFWISDASGHWQRADARIKENMVVLSSPNIQEPKYVRYAFSGKPKVNLVNQIGLPAYPFRTDTFEK